MDQSVVTAALFCLVVGMAILNARSARIIWRARRAVEEAKKTIEECDGHATS